MDLSSNCVLVRHIQLHTKVYVLCSYNLISYLIQHMDDGLHLVCCTSLIGCCELNFFVDKYYPSDSQSVPGKDMNKMCISSLVRWLLAQPHFSLGSKVVSPIMDSCLTRTKGTGLDSMVLCLLLPQLRLCHMSPKSPLKTICHCSMQRQLDCIGDLDMFKSYHTMRKYGVVHHAV